MVMKKLVLLNVHENIVSSFSRHLAFLFNVPRKLTGFLTELLTLQIQYAKDKITMFVTMSKLFKLAYSLNNFSFYM